MKKIGIVADDIFLRHAVEDCGAVYLMETPKRLAHIYSRIRSNLQPQERYRMYQPSTEHLNVIQKVHSEFYLKQLCSAEEKNNPFWYSADTYIMRDSFKTACLAASSTVQLADAIMNGEIDHGFAIVRPPGHHADQSQAMGYCLLNNAAIAAMHLLQNRGLSKILILDFDAHHGNGTQQIFYSSNSVMCISIHEANLFPKNSGHTVEIGEKSGTGYNINLPVYSSFGDEEYSFIFSGIVEPIVQKYQPEFIIVSAGYDGHVRECISNLQLSTQWYRDATWKLMQWASKFSQNRLLLVLEGGYNPEVLEESIAGTLETLSDPDKEVQAESEHPDNSRTNRAVEWANTTIYPVLRQCDWL